MRFLRRREPQASARQDRDEWLQWLELGGARPATVKGYRWTTNRLHVAVLLGHRDTKTTKRVYDHSTVYDVRRRMDALQ